VEKLENFVLQVGFNAKKPVEKNLHGQLLCVQATLER
jgi:hypothetical protein